MTETPSSFSNLESPAAGSVLPSGQHQLRGWVMPKLGGNFVDVRARIGSRIFPAIHGFPRADLAAHFKIGRPLALAEFYVTVDFIEAGPAEVMLEALAISGLWSVFQSIDYTVTTSNRESCVPAAPGPIYWHEYGRVLQALLRARRRHPEKTSLALAQAAVADLPDPSVLRYPHLPFHGHLDEPAAISVSKFGRFTLRGYLFHETLSIKRVLATVDLQIWQEVAHDLPSAAAADIYPQFAQASTCGLFALIDAPSQLPNPVCLRIYAELTDGSLHLCSVQRGCLTNQEDEKTPYSLWTPNAFHETITALDAALIGRHLARQCDGATTREIARIEADYYAHAPRTVPVAIPLRPAPVQSTAPFPQRVLLVSHNLQLEGAPLFLLDYARELARQGTSISVLSPTGGPLAGDFVQLGAIVSHVDADQLFSVHTESEAQAVLATIKAGFDFKPFDLVVCNTFTTFWAVHAAKSVGQAVLMYVHESTTPACFYRDRTAPIVPLLIERALQLADCVSFTTASTRSYHVAYGRPERHRLTPGWVDLTSIDHWRNQNPITALRASFGLQPGELLVTNVGTVSDRKGQHIFARAVDLFHRRHPALAARTRFIMLGSRHSPFDDMLRVLLAEIARPNLVVHPETTDYFRYYAAADLTVCSSYEESSPRVVMEAMACEVPLLASQVHGIPELARSGQEASFVQAGDTLAFCDSMAALLHDRCVARTMAINARKHAAAEFSATAVLPRHMLLARAVTGGEI